MNELVLDLRDDLRRHRSARDLTQEFDRPSHAPRRRRGSEISTRLPSATASTMDPSETSTTSQDADLDRQVRRRLAPHVQQVVSQLEGTSSVIAETTQTSEAENLRKPLARGCQIQNNHHPLSRNKVRIKDMD